MLMYFQDSSTKFPVPMDIDLSLPSDAQDRLDEEPNTINNLLCNEDKLHIEGDTGNMVIVAHLHSEDGITFNSSTSNLADLKEDVNLEPLPGMEFVSHQEAYAFYQEYARSMGFNTAIQNSRRSKTSREFIDAKFACSRYGTKREYDKGNRPRVRQITKQEPESAGRRSCGKTDCKASMHVKRRPDGKWVIHSFVKEHNHELLPAQAVSEQTRKIYAAMARQYAEYKSVVGLKSETRILCDKNRNLVLEVGDAKRLLGFFTQMQNVNSNFFHAVELSDDLCLKSFLWIDAKGRHDYSHFCDVVAFDTTYIRNKYKIPLALLIGVNQHYQFLLLGCAIVSDESFATYSWIMQTWLKAMGGQAPKVILTEQDGSIKSAVSEVFPNTQHCFYLWHILGRVSDNLGHIIKKHDKFMEKFEKWIYRSWTDEEFEKRWHKLISRFELEKKDQEYLHSLYEDRKLWVPTYMKNTFLAGMSTIQRSESINYYFDKYVHKKTTVSEFLNQYESIIQDRYEEEARADSDTWNKQPALKSPSPFEKQMASIYTHAILKKFQIEVLGTIACHPKKEGEDELTATFRVKDSEKNQDFVVTWNEVESEVCCICHLFEFKGFLCRHGMVVLQMCGFSTIPSQCILKRWTKDAKERHLSGEGSEQVSSRVQRYNLLCNRAIRLGEEGSLSQESYNIALRALDDAFTSCMGVNNACKILPDGGTSAATHELLSIEDDCPSSSSRSFVKTTKKKNPSKKRKMNAEAEAVTIGAQDSFQSMEKLNSRPATPLDGFYGTQQSVQGMVQLNLLGPTPNSYYGSHPTIQGLGQLNSIAPNHDGYYGQQSMHGLGQMDFFRPPPGFTYGIREEPNVRSAQLHDDGTKHA